MKIRFDKKNIKNQMLRDEIEKQINQIRYN
jgi:hypothetical protein